MTKAEQTRLRTWRLKVLEQAGECSRNVTRTCRHFGISRQAFYKWKKRYAEHGEAGLCDRPRTPHRSPRAIPREVISKILYLRQNYHSLFERRDGFERLDRDQRLVLGVLGMEVWRARSEKNILITMPKNRLISGMSLLPSTHPHHLAGLFIPLKIPFECSAVSANRAVVEWSLQHASGHSRLQVGAHHAIDGEPAG